MLEIYGVTRSRASRIVWLCEEMGLAYTQVPVMQAYRMVNAGLDPYAADAPLNTASADFLALSPAGAIPVLRDGDFVMSESLACTLYLARKYGVPIGPANASEDGLMMQWSFYAATSIEAAAMMILVHHRPGQAQPAEDQALVAAASEQLIRPLRVLERQLGEHRYLVGTRFTVADLNVAETLRHASGHHQLMDMFPATSAWLADCHARPAYQKMWAARLNEPE